MPNPPGPTFEQRAFEPDDMDIEVFGSMRSIMPFRDMEVEQDFLRHFHNQRTVLDCFVYITLFAASMLLVWKKGHGWPGTCYALMNLGLFLSTFSKVYPLWRPYLMYAVRIPFLAYFFIIYHAQVHNLKVPTFITAAYFSGIYLARFKMPLYCAVLFPVPLRGTFLVIHTYLIAFLIHSSKEECQEMVTANADFRAFAKQLEGLYILWEDRGSQPPCRSLCEDLLDVAMFPAGCQQMCSWTLPLLWRFYGRPWLGACLVHRYIMVVGLGYLLPLSSLYIWEMRGRSRYARERRLITCSTKACLLKGVLPVLSEMVIIMITLLLLTSEMQITRPGSAN